MNKTKIQLQVIKYLSENTKCSYRLLREHIADFTKDERKMMIASTKRGESKIKKKKELISQEDLVVWGTLMDLIASQVVTPITHFGDMDKSQLIVSDAKKLNALLIKDEAI